MDDMNHCPQWQQQIDSDLGTTAGEVGYDWANEVHASYRASKSKCYAADRVQPVKLTGFARLTLKLITDRSKPHIQADRVQSFVQKQSLA